MSVEGDLVRRGIGGDGSNIDIFSGQLMVDDELFSKSTPATITTAGNVTYTAAQLLGRLILRDPAGAARSDVTPTAALIVAAIKHCNIGSSFEFTVHNDADADETITVTAGTGVTLIGTMTIAQNNSKRFLARVTAVASPAVTIYSLGTAVH
jgi:hypothetical protein